MGLLNKISSFLFLIILLSSVSANYLGTFEFDVLENGSILVDSLTNYSEI